MGETLGGGLGAVTQLDDDLGDDLAEHAAGEGEQRLAAEAVLVRVHERADDEDADEAADDAEEQVGEDELALVLHELAGDEAADGAGDDEEREVVEREVDGQVGEVHAILLVPAARVTAPGSYLSCARRVPRGQQPHRAARDAARCGDTNDCGDGAFRTAPAPRYASTRDANSDRMLC